MTPRRGRPLIPTLLHPPFRPKEPNTSLPLSHPHTMTCRNAQVLVVGHLPRLLAGLHDLVLGRGQETDVVEPRGPAAGDLSGVVVVLGVVDPAVTAGNLLGSVKVLKVTVAELVGADWTVSMWFPRTLLCV